MARDPQRRRAMLLGIWQYVEPAAGLLCISVVLFGSLALVVKGIEAWHGARRASAEIRLNLAWYAADAILLAPFVTAGVVLVRHAAHATAAAQVLGAWWAAIPGALTLIAVLFLGDFVGYWRHRLEHTRWLWPAHAIHHSDTQMTWLTLARFHPVNRVVTAALDTLVLALLGFPAWALVANNLVRHFYGQLVHADFDWSYGPLGRLFVSPVMHRWHHAREVTGTGSNFATLFSVFDCAFGTYYVPGPCTVPLGTTEDVGRNLVAQVIYPFIEWKRELRAARRTVPLRSDPA